MSYESMGFEEGAIAGAGVEIYDPKILEEPLLKKAEVALKSSWRDIFSILLKTKD
jgi:hypothetical protein